MSLGNLSVEPTCLTMPPDVAALWSGLLMKTMATRSWTNDLEADFCMLMGWCIVNRYFAPHGPIYRRDDGQFLGNRYRKPRTGDDIETYRRARAELAWWETSLDRVEQWTVAHQDRALPQALDAVREFRVRCRKALTPAGPYQPPAPQEPEPCASSSRSRRGSPRASSPSSPLAPF